MEIEQIKIQTKQHSTNKQKILDKYINFVSKIPSVSEILVACELSVESVNSESVSSDSWKLSKFTLPPISSEQSTGKRE